METFIKVLPAVIEAAGASEEVLEAACLGAWKHAVGETLSARARAESLRDHKLVIAVEDRVWQRQLEQMRDQFLFRLNDSEGHSVKRLALLSFERLMTDLMTVVNTCNCRVTG